MSRKKKVGVLIVHGMGNQHEFFAEEGIQGLRETLSVDAGDVAFESCFWSPILQKHQDRLWTAMRRRSVMGWGCLREWVVGSFGDPASYLAGYFKSPDPKHKPVYTDVHECIGASLKKLEAGLGDELGKPLVILAHSLGSAIVTNYYWDAMREEEKREKRKEEEEKDCPSLFQQMATLTTLVTYGSNIPLFIPPPPKSDDKIECIQFPHPKLPAHLNGVARWINVYAPSDILGYPLCGIWEETHGTTIQDVPLPVGPWYARWNPLSHNYYLTDKEFQRIVADEIRSILNHPPGTLKKRRHPAPAIVVQTPQEGPEVEAVQ